MQVRIKRVYDEPTAEDGFRVLVDRLWPRGLSKERARVDLWAKEVAPSAQLRKAYHHEGMTWEAFVDAYRAELSGANGAAVDELRSQLTGKSVVTLLHAVHDEQHNHAVLLRDALEG